MKEKGQSLIEAVVALGAAVLVISAIAIIVVTAVNNTDYTKYQNQASAFAQQGAEIVKNIAESSWYDFTNNYKNISYCLPSATLIESTSPCTTIMENNAIFIREVDILHASGNCVGGGSEIKSIVYWTDGKCASGKYCHTAEVDSCLYDINSKPGI